MADQMLSERSSSRIGEQILVLIEDEQEREGRAAHQGPEVDGTTRFEKSAAGNKGVVAGRYIRGEVTGSDGADLLARAL
ncbi:MAG: hypothetical protein EBX92_05760 [Actinobacteria bacterium]|nr:hypothetical protein [Actinomycetota bacterium]